jgi:hypothetical protein
LAADFAAAIRGIPKRTCFPKKCGSIAGR